MRREVIKSMHFTEEAERLIKEKEEEESALEEVKEIIRKTKFYEDAWFAESTVQIYEKKKKKIEGRIEDLEEQIKEERIK